MQEYFCQCFKDPVHSLVKSIFELCRKLETELNVRLPDKPDVMDQVELLDGFSSFHSIHFTIGKT